MEPVSKYFVVRYASGECEWHAKHVWEAHQRVVPWTSGQIVAGPMPIQDAINLCKLVNKQRELEPQI